MNEYKIFCENCRKKRFQVIEKEYENTDNIVGEFFLKYDFKCKKCNHINQYYEYVQPQYYLPYKPTQSYNSIIEKLLP